jgi:tryptophan synthase beta chain
MGAVDTERQALNVFRMELLGAEVRPVTRGADPEGRRQRGHAGVGGPVEDTHYCLGSVMGPHPYPWMVRELQRVVGDEARAVPGDPRGGDPDWWWPASAGAPTRRGPSPGSWTPGPAGRGGGGRGAAVTTGCRGGARDAVVPLAGRGGQIKRRSRSRPGSTIPGLGPEHAHLAATGRARTRLAGDAEVLGRLPLLSETEGIIPALEPAHALAWVAREAGGRSRPGVDRVDHPVGAGRQGRGPGPGEPCPCLRRRCGPSGGRGASC